MFQIRSPHLILWHRCALSSLRSVRYIISTTLIALVLFFHALLNENMEFLYRERPFLLMHRREPCSKSIMVRSPCTKDLGAFTLSLPAIRSDSYLYSCEPYRPPQPLPLSSGWRIAASNGEDTAWRTSLLVQVTFEHAHDSESHQDTSTVYTIYCSSWYNRRRPTPPLHL